MAWFGFGSENKGMAEHFEEHLGARNGVEDPSRRGVLKKAGGVAIAGAAMSAGIMPEKAEAALGMIGTNMLRKYLREAPSAIKAQADITIHSAYGYYKLGDLSVTSRRDGLLTALNMMRIKENRVVPYRIREETPFVAHAYHLLVHRWGYGSDINKFYHIINKSKNKQLIEYSSGVALLYDNSYTTSRQRFSNGLFLAAELGKREFERTGVDWDDSLNAEGNAYRLAKEFVEAEPQKKARILDAVDRKFKRVKFDPKAQLKVKVNTRTGEFKYIPDSYKMEAVFWNLGGLVRLKRIMLNKKTTEDELILIYRKAYNNMYHKFKYGSGDYSLYYN